MQIQNGVFIITGGASGLGAATARMIAENGGSVKGVSNGFVICTVLVKRGNKHVSAFSLDGDAVRLNRPTDSSFVGRIRR